jgi:hypothetical protein
MRASDDERERGIAVLRDAVVASRLTLEEFSERVDQAHGARTTNELALLTRDLPQAQPTLPGAPQATFRAAFSRLVRKGPWTIPEHSDWRSYFGTIVIDLRHGRLSGPELVLDIYNLFGTVTVLVPAGIVVDVEGGGLFASQVIDTAPVPPPPNAPRLRIRATGPGGTLYVRCPERPASERPHLAPGSPPPPELESEH